MKLSHLLLATSTLLFAGLSQAIPIGSNSSYPGFSARDILMSNPVASSGIYWIDPDLAGGNTPFQVYANMVTDGGGWTLAHDAQGIRPDMDGYTAAINILAVNQTARLMFEGNGFVGSYFGNYGAALPTIGWSILSGNAGLLAGKAWNDIDFSQFNLYVRETVTTHYPLPTTPTPTNPSRIPTPASLSLLAAGAMGLLAIRKQRT